MGIYDNEIDALQRQIDNLESQRSDLESKINNTSDPELIKVYQDEISDIIDDIDELNEAIEKMENHKSGSPNGYDTMSDEVDYSDNNNWGSIRRLFGFGKRGKEDDN